MLEFPTQIVLNDAVALTTGTGVTIKLTVFDDEQPKALAAVTVYNVVEAGDTVTVPPINAPGFQV